MAESGRTMAATGQAPSGPEGGPMARSREEVVKVARRFRPDYLLAQAEVTLARAQKEAQGLARFGVT